MQCDCITATEKRMADHMTESLGVQATATCKGTLLVLGKHTLDAHIGIPFEVKADKTGFKKGKVMNMTASYCPFCGTRTTPEPAVSATADTAPSAAG